MSALLRGEISDTNLSKNSRGGTEQMRDRLLKYVDKNLLEKVSIHFSRVREENWIEDGINVVYLHDLCEDPESSILADKGYESFSKLVFVTHWQRDQYIAKFNIPYSYCTVIENAIEKDICLIEKPKDKINFIYHTTPHRGLELLFPVFQELCKEFENIHLDVYSSFEVYGWKERDKQYQTLFDALKQHPNVTYHGAVSNEEVLNALDNAHIFLYPSIWQETSCIAMIEAIRSGVLCIHPNLGALHETSSEATYMYDYHEDNNVHMNRCYIVTKKILEAQIRDPELINIYMQDSRTELPRNSIQNYTAKWTNLLKELI